MMTPPLKHDAAPVPRVEEQLSELRRELALRANVYPKLIREGKLKASTADYATRCLEAAIRTLEYMRDHRAVIIAAVNAPKAGAE